MKKMLESFLRWVILPAIFGLVIFILIVAAAPWFGYEFQFREWFHRMAEKSDIPLKSVVSQIELYQMNAAGRNDINLTKGESAILSIGSEQKLYFGLNNLKEDNTSYKYPLLEIRFEKKDVDEKKIIINNEESKAQGWLQMEPPGRYRKGIATFLPLRMPVPSTPLILTCKEKGTYKVRYIITSINNEPYESGNFILEAK